MIFTEAEVESLCALNNETVIPVLIIEPSKWYESKKILMTAGSAIPGHVVYKNTPYWEEPVNCISQYHPAQDITIVGPAQDGKTFMVIEPMIGYTIECNPGNILHLTGNSELSPDASLRIDGMIDNCKIRYLIKPSIVKAIKNRTGDTAIRKEFTDGIYRVNSITKKNALRQNDIAVLIIDDTDAAKKTDKKVGNLRNTAKGRTKAFEWRAKRVYTSSPEIKDQSFIWESWELSDKRLYYIPPPCCYAERNQLITLKTAFAREDGQDSGLYWELDEHGRVEPKSVCYICELCGEKFDERDKLKWMGKEAGAKWISTAIPKELYHYGYKKSGLYASPGMTSWYTLAVSYMQCNPPGLPRLEDLWQTYLNIQLGEPYSPPTNGVSASDLMKKCRNYTPGVIPETLSEADGNGDIIMLTWAADCNGLLNDARIDWQIKAISRNGAKYAVEYGSFGAFIPNQTPEQKANTVREKYTYEMHRPNSVWRLVSEKLSQVFKTDTGRQMKIGVTGIDVGYLTDHIFNYIDNSQFGIFALMGDKEHDMVIRHENIPNFKLAQSRHNLYTVNVNAIKDKVANRMKLPWNQKEDVSQPHEFMNFPNWPYTGTKDNPNLGFFEHYESEERKENDKGYYGWAKKGPTSRNHFWDCEIYSDVIVDIFLWRLFKKGAKEEVFTWSYYASQVPPRRRDVK